MKATTTIKPEMPDNADKFQDAFFKRFALRHAVNPLQLTEDISKNYLFHTFYSDVTCAIGVFLCSYQKACQLVQKELGRGVLPVKMTRGRSLVAFSCYEYKNVYGVLPYNEIAMTIPIMVAPSMNVPVSLHGCSAISNPARGICDGLNGSGRIARIDSSVGVNSARNTFALM